MTLPLALLPFSPFFSSHLSILHNSINTLYYVYTHIYIILNLPDADRYYQVRKKIRESTSEITHYLAEQYLVSYRKEFEANNGIAGGANAKQQATNEQGDDDKKGNVEQDIAAQQGNVDKKRLGPSLYHRLTIPSAHLPTPASPLFPISPTNPRTQQTRTESLYILILHHAPSASTAVMAAHNSIRAPACRMIALPHDPEPIPQQTSFGAPANVPLLCRALS